MVIFVLPHDLFEPDCSNKGICRKLERKPLRNSNQVHGGPLGTSARGSKMAVREVRAELLTTCVWAG